MRRPQRTAPSAIESVSAVPPIAPTVSPVRPIEVQLLHVLAWPSSMTMEANLARLAVTPATPAPNGASVTPVLSARSAISHRPPPTASAWTATTTLKTARRVRAAIRPASDVLAVLPTSAHHATPAPSG